jgi:hypothetical protein
VTVAIWCQNYDLDNIFDRKILTPKYSQIVGKIIPFFFEIIAYAFFRRELANVAKNSHHNIGPWA